MDCEAFDQLVQKVLTHQATEAEKQAYQQHITNKSTPCDDEWQAAEPAEPMAELIRAAVKRHSSPGDLAEGIRQQVVQLGSSLAATYSEARLS